MYSIDHAMPDRTGADIRLERSVTAALRVIAAACAERDAAPVRAARQRLARVYGATRLLRRLEHQRPSA